MRITKLTISKKALAMVKDKVFQPNKTSAWWKNAVVGGTWSSKYIYAIGYKKAGDILVDNAIRYRCQDSLFFPICFNYRHFIELFLKGLILNTGCLIRYRADCGESIVIDHTKTTEDILSKLEKTHSIRHLAELLRSSLQKVSDEQFNEEIWNYLIEFHGIDPTSQAFRYFINKRHKLFFPNQERYDLENIKSKVTKIEQYFSGIDAWLSHEIEVVRDYLKHFSGFKEEES